MTRAVIDMQRTAIVTGSSGGIGSAICKAFKAEDWTVIGLDKSSALTTYCDHVISLDLADLGTKDDESFRRTISQK